VKRLSILGERSSSKRGGYTLIELIVVIAIISVMLGTAVWTITGILPRWRLQGAANEVVSRMQQARSAAVKNNRSVIVEFVNKGSATASRVKVWVDMDRDNAEGAGELLTDVMIPDKHPLAYVTTIVDGDNAAAASDLLVLGADGSMRGFLTGGTVNTGKMPVIVKLTSQSPTTPAEYCAIIDRSGIARVSTTCVAP